MDNQNLPTRAQLRRTKKKSKKHFYKRWWFWTIIFVLLLAGGGLTGMKMTSMGPFATKTTKVTKKKKSVKKTTKKESGVTLNQYNGIYLSENDGLSQEILQKLLGKPNSTSSSTVQTLQTTVNTWTKVSNGELGSNMTVNFSNDHAIGKAISGLKVSRSTKLSLSDYNKIQNGISKDQLLDDLGNPNGYSETTINGTTTNDFTYSSDINGETGANFIVNLTNGVVSGKSQTGLK